MSRIAWILAALPLGAGAQQAGGTHELLGQMGSRTAFLVLHASRNPDTSWQLAGEYLIVATRQRRYVEGESSPEIGVTTLREGDTPILFGRPGTGELRGVWRNGVFRGTRYATGGQERERFEFSEAFPSLAAYSGTVRCEAREGGYQASLAYRVQAGKVQSFVWQARREPGGESCRLAGLAQEPMQGGIRLAAGDCRVTLRDLGEGLRLAGEDCSERCGGAAALEPILVDRRGGCALLAPQPR